MVISEQRLTKKDPKVRRVCAVHMCTRACVCVSVCVCVRVCVCVCV